MRQSDCEALGTSGLIEGLDPSISKSLHRDVLVCKVKYKNMGEVPSIFFSN